MKNKLKLLFWLFISSLNFNLIIRNYNLTIGGTQGLSLILVDLFHSSLSIIILIINLLMFIVSVLFLNSEVTKSIIISTFVYPVFVKITANLHLPFSSCKTIIFIISGLISGLSLGNILKLGYSTGGINVLLILFKKYFNVLEYISNFIINSIIIIFGNITFGMDNLFNSLLVLSIGSLVVNIINKNVNHCQIS